MQKLLCLMLLSAALGASTSAQVLDLPQGDLKDKAAIAKAMPELAKRAITVYQEPDRDRYLNNLFRLQIAAGRYSEAVTTLHDVIELRRATDPSSALPLLPFEMLAKARAKEPTGGLAFNEAFKQEFREVFEHLDNKSAGETINWFGGDLGRMRDDLRAAVDKQRGKDRITLTDAVDLIRKYFVITHGLEASRNGRSGLENIDLRISN
jgi:uncharacterized protein